MLHNCTQCDYKSKVKCNVQRHMRTQHKLYSNNRIPVIVNKIIQEADQIDHVDHHEPLPSVQYGSGVVREQDNQAYNKVVEIANSWKNVCEKTRKAEICQTRFCIYQNSCMGEGGLQIC